jgi:alkylation response protein AidB-like acyl-CoA dehydrogenase
MIAGDDLALFERSLEHATANKTGSALDAALDELGWGDALSADPRAAVSVLFALQGAANASSSALDRVLAAALGREGCAVVLPAMGEWRAPGVTTDDGLEVLGAGTATLRSGDVGCVIVASAGDSHVAFEVDADALPQRPVVGVDASLGLIEVAGMVRGAVEVGPVDWGAAVAAGQLALGHELLGAARRMLELARQHALDRVQFGQPIAHFQAVRHRLADTLVAIDSAEAALAAAWLDPTPQTAAMAKAIAGRGARVAARHCQQVLAGIGFTTEHPFHRYVWRVLALEQLLGSTRRLTGHLGRDILDRRQLPPLLPL